MLKLKALTKMYKTVSVALNNFWNKERQISKNLLVNI